jgi:archaemetzincin
MNHSFKQLLYLLIFLFLIGCKNNDKTSLQEKKITAPGQRKNKEILLQPFSDLPIKKAEYIFKKIQKIGLNTKLLTAINLPSLAYYKPRNRYRADSLIDWLRDRVIANQVIVGITSKDISTTKLPNPDSGIMGLGFMNGPACIVSTFRLHSDEQLFKTILHELGHNFGLDHCPVKTCFMRDAEGKNPIDQEKEFCLNCKKVLVKNGWKL